MPRKKAPQPIAQIWVCPDCMIENVNEGVAISYRVNGNVFPCDVTPNFGTTELDSGDDYEYGMMEFSHITCDSCGDHLAGARYRFAVWEWF